MLNVPCAVILYSFSTLNIPGCQYQYEIQNHYPFPEASVLLENVGVSAARGISGPSKSKSRNYNLIWDASRNREEISVTKKRKFRICELEIT